MDATLRGTTTRVDLRVMTTELEPYNRIHFSVKSRNLLVEEECIECILAPTDVATNSNNFSLDRPII